MSGALKKAGFVLFTLLIALAATEILARLVFRNIANDDVYLERAFTRLLNSDIRFNHDSGNYSKKFGYVLTPYARSTQTKKEYSYTSATNSLGFRAREVLPKTINEYRVMLLGDSFFWGVGVSESETISSVMENLVGPKLSVYNYSVIGYNTVQELLVAQTYSDALRPDHIILGFFIGNDIIPNAATLIDQDGNYATSAEMEANIKGELRESFGAFFHSMIFRIAALHIYVPRLRYQIATRDYVIAKSFDLLLRLKKLASNKNARFSVVVFYPRDGVQGGIVETWSGSRRAGELISDFCRKNSIEVLDLIKYMHSEEHKDKYFFAEDGHPNAEGNLVIAKAMLKDLIEARIIP